MQTMPTLKTRFAKTLVAIGLGICICGAVYAATRLLRALPEHSASAHISMDLSNPDVLIVSQHLSQLPSDLARASALSGLTEGLAGAYVESAQRLSLEGSLRRLAFEHNLALNERFVAALLDAPAEVALWRNGKGRPDAFIAVMQRTALSRLAQPMAKIALEDRQLKQAGSFSFGADQATVYTLEYGVGHALALVGLGDRWVVLSDPALVLDADNRLTDNAQRLLDALLHGRQPWHGALPPAAGVRHSLVLGPKALTLDYARFVPALTGARLDHDNGNWRLSLRLKDAALLQNPGLGEIWKALPLNAALCSAVPVQWTEVAKPLHTLLKTDRAAQAALPAALATLNPVAAVCWYGDSRLAAPLFVARADQPLPANTGALLAAIAQRAWTTPGAPVPDARGNGSVLGAVVSSSHGVARAGGDKGFSVTLAQRGKLILFSPDRQLVARALAVASQQAAALGDESGLSRPAWLVEDPKALAALLRTEVQDALPQDDEPYFNGVARRSLLPRLTKWSSTHAAVAAVPAGVGSDGFVALDFQPLRQAAN